MFHRLRLRLMLVNMSVIFLLFSLLTAGIYFFVQDQMAHGREHMMKRASFELANGIRTDLPPGPGHGPKPHGEPGLEPGPGPGPGPGPEPDQESGPRPGRLFFARLNTQGEITATSSFVPLTQEQFSRLIKKALAVDAQALINLSQQDEYAFYKTSLPETGETLIVFQDSQRDREFLRLLVTALSVAGLVCMLLSLLGSYFMANKAMAPIQRAWQQQRDFLADASHELRTPLAVIQTNLDVVRYSQEETVASQAQWLDNIHEEVFCMTKLVESLLFLSQTDSHQQFLKKDWFWLDLAAETAVDPFRPVAAAKEVKLSFEGKANLAYYGDELKLRQVVGILLDNAIRHTPEKGKVTVRLDQQESIVLTIADTGEGIPPDDLERIFWRFYQSDASRAKGGSGLGLSIGKWIVTSHGGEINVASTLGKGTVFTVKLPPTPAPVNGIPLDLT